jgi:nucleoside-diphosphate-sugar epimerase
MKCLIIGGNRFVGLRLSHILHGLKDIELHTLNRTGLAPHCPDAIAHKGDRRYLSQLHLDQDWDLVFDFACFTEPDAITATDFFRRVGRYVFISTASVYDPGAQLLEAAFAPLALNLNSPDNVVDYQSGKRRAEAVFAQQSRFPVLSVRFPVILGPDDYTERLVFHTERVKNQEPIYFPNPQARVSMVHAEDAARFLQWTIEQPLTGPLNVCSTRPISMAELMQQIEWATEVKALTTEVANTENASPYGPRQDWFMATDKLNKAGFTARPILEWLPELIGSSNIRRPKGFVH